MKKKKNQTRILIAIVIIALIFILYKKNKHSFVLSSAENPTKIARLNESKPLKKGVRGEEVVQLQTYLNTKGENLTVDGIFGDKTAKAIQDHFGKEEVTLYDLKTASIGQPIKAPEETTGNTPPLFGDRITDFDYVPNQYNYGQ